MANYSINKGTLDWDVPLNADLSDINARLTSTETRTLGRTYYYLVAASTAPAAVKAKADYVCTGIGDQIQIQSAVNAAFADGAGIVQLTDGIFSISAPITLHPAVTLQGAHGDQIFNPTQLTAQSFIRPDALFVGGAAIVLLGQTAGGYANKSSEQRIFNLTIIGDLSPAGVHGIQASDYIHGVVLRDVAVVRPKGKGIYTFTENASQPFSWTFHRVLVDNAGDVGFHLINHTDCTMIDAISIGAINFGYQLSNMPNSRFVGCRAEWSGAHGYKIEGNFGTGAGSGGMLFSGCSTDRNGQNGFDITSTGNGPILLDGVETRRDGRNSGAGGGGYSGIFASAATNPLIITGWGQYPGVDDNGTQTNSPQVGGTFNNNTHVQIDNAYIHGATTAVTQSGNTNLLFGANITYATGLTSAPTLTVQENVLRTVRNSTTLSRDSTAQLRITPNANASASTSVGGALNITNTGSTGAGLVVYSNQAAPTGHLIAARADNAAFNQVPFYAESHGTSHSISVNHQGTGANSSGINIASNNTAASTLQVSGVETGRGSIKVSHTGSGTDANASALSIDLLGTGTAAQGIFVTSTTGPTTGALVHLRNGGTGALVEVTATGDMKFGSGTGATDSTLNRSGTNALATPGFFAMGSGQSGGDYSVFGNNAKSLKVGSAGGGLSVAEGSNARMGTLVLTGATPVVVANTSITATTRVFLTANTPGGTPGHFWVSARTAGTSFSVTGTAGDTSTVAYLLVEPA